MTVVAAGAVLGLAALGSVFVSGALVEVLLSSRQRRRAAPESATTMLAAAFGLAPPESRGAVSPEPRPLLHRFCRGGGRFFWRNFRLLLLHLVVAVLAAGATYAGLRFATSPLRDSLSEAGAWTRALLPLAGGERS